MGGKEKYGDGFQTAYSFIQMHNNLAGDSYCDHMHDGYAFLITHAALTMAFEQSLQMIDPKVVVPYWDFTIDSVAFDNGGLQAWYDSEVFKDDWFGNPAPDNDDKVLAAASVLLLVDLACK